MARGEPTNAQLGARWVVTIRKDNICLLTYICLGVYLDPMDHQSVFDVIGDATRRRILALLVAEGELCVCELMAALDDIQPKVSRHLSVVRDAGLASVRREGTWVFYRLASPLPP